MDSLPQVAADAVLAAAESGAVVLTANTRAAREWRRQYDARQQQHQRAAWPSASIMPWSAWLDSLWHEYLLSPERPASRRLNALQEHAVWERVISSSEHGRELLAISGAADLAREAWNLLHEYCVEDLSALGTTLHGEMFHRWAAEFARTCRERGWTDPARIPGQLLCAVSSGAIGVPERIIFAGFDKLTPRQLKFVAALRARGTVCELAADDTEAAATVCCIPLNDTAAEIQCAAEWARGCVEHEPTARVGVIVPNLEELRGRVERAFAEVLSPATLVERSSRRAFELSLGRALVELPVVHTALELLRWLAGPRPIVAVGALIRSPFLKASITEAGRRALLDAEMRRRCGPEVSLSDVRRLTRASDKHSCPELDRLLTGAQRALDLEPKPPSAWCNIFSAVLSAAGWPGERPLDSVEYQSVQAWLELLRLFGTLENTDPQLTFQEAVARLGQFAALRPFQPENIGAPVQVLGLLEAAGSRFDYLWVMGLDDETWPPRAKPNLFLPLSVQRRYAMPHASAADDLQFAQLVTERLLRSAHEIVFSYPQVDGERPLRPSPLLPFPVSHFPFPVWHSRSGWVDEIHACHEQLEASEACTAVEARADDVRGGTRVFQLQAACPFRAFAELRLGASALETPESGLDNRQRGIIVHKALEYVWQELRSYAELSALTADDQQRLIASCVERALADFPPLLRDEWTRRFAVLERERLAALISEWLEIEKQRAPFEVIGREEWQRVAIGGVPVDIRIDRLDRLADGRKVIIDYKTGAPKSLADAWDGARPDEPQLPLYAITVPGDIAALAFAHLKTGKLRFCGQSADPGILPSVGVPKDISLHDRIAEWRKVLDALGESFVAGEARVDPKDPDKTCRYCGLQPLCRIAEYGLPDDAEPAEDADE